MLAARNATGLAALHSLLHLVRGAYSVANVAEQDYRFEVPLDLDPDDWITVTGGGLDQPVRIKVRIAGNRAYVTALSIENQEPITSTSLRALRLAEIGRQLIASADQSMGARFGRNLIDIEFVSQAEAAELGGKRQELPEGGWSVLLEHEGQARRFTARGMEWVAREWLSELEVAGEDIDLRRRGRGSKSATDQELMAFARAYLQAQAVDAYGAKTRTAHRLHMHRGTVYRWIAMCRDRGFLPEEKGA